MDQDLSPIEEACAEAGSQAELARLVQESPSVVNQWVKRRRPIPTAKGPAIEFAANGLVPVEKIFPHEKWSRIPDPSWPHPEGRPTLDPQKPPAVAEDALDAPTEAQGV